LNITLAAIFAANGPILALFPLFPHGSGSNGPFGLHRLGESARKIDQHLLEIVMSTRDFLSIRTELESRVQKRTGRQVRDLTIKMSSDGVRLVGKTNTFYVKQLAQHCVREVLPDVELVNEIRVA
jgi:hypothetical protein